MDSIFSVRYDGIYYYNVPNNTNGSFDTCIYLRFYNNGKVSVLFSGIRNVDKHLYNLLGNNDIDSHWGFGKFIINGDNIFFK